MAVAKKPEPKKSESTSLAKPGAAPTDQQHALSTFLGEEMSMSERPDFIAKGDTSGTEDIGVNDIRLPRLTIAQGLSPQVTPGESAYIDGLKLFEMFNDVTQNVYGMGPLYFIVSRRDVRRIEFIPRSEGGGVRDLSVPEGDDRLEWRKGAGEKGEDLPPLATKFDEYCIHVLFKDHETGHVVLEPIVLSIKHTNKFNRKAVKDLNTFIKMHASKGEKAVPIYGVIYAIETRSEKNSKGVFGVPLISQVGYIPRNHPEWFDKAKGFAESLEGKNVVINREGAADEDAEFNVEEMERQNAAAPPSSGRGPRM